MILNMKKDSNSKFRNMTLVIPQIQTTTETSTESNPGPDKIMIQIQGNLNGYASLCREEILSSYSPREQVQYGEYSHNVICTSGKELVFKHDGSPACVFTENVF